MLNKPTQYKNVLYHSSTEMEALSGAVSAET